MIDREALQRADAALRDYVSKQRINIVTMDALAVAIEAYESARPNPDAAPQRVNTGGTENFNQNFNHTNGRDA